MASRVEELLEQILQELVSSRVQVSQEEGTAKVVEAAQKKTEKPGVTDAKSAASLKGAAGAVSALGSGDSRTIASSLAGQIGGTTAGIIGLGIAGVTATAQRGYNEFNLFEKFDKTTVEPYKKLENIVMEYGRYGKSFSEDQINKMFEGEKKAQERGFREVEKLREIIDTSAKEEAIEWIGKKIGLISEDEEDPNDKSRSKSEQSKKMQKSVGRNDKYEDNY